MDPYFVAFYPAPGGRLDLVAGLGAWLAAGGKFEYATAWRLDEWDPASSAPATFYTEGEHLQFDAADPGSLAAFVAGRCAEVTLSAPFYTPSVEVCYYPRAPVDPLIQCVYHYPHRWGLGGGGLPAAYAALFGFAHAAGAAYVLTSTAEGHHQMSRQFVQYDGQFWFVLTPEHVQVGHRMLALDVNHELGGRLPLDTPTLCVEPMPRGYARHWLSGHSPPEFSDDWPRLKRPGPRLI